MYDTQLYGSHVVCESAGDLDKKLPTAGDDRES